MTSLVIPSPYLEVFLVQGLPCPDGASHVRLIVWINVCMLYSFRSYKFCSILERYDNKVNTLTMSFTNMSQQCDNIKIFRKNALKTVRRISKCSPSHFNRYDMIHETFRFSVMILWPNSNQNLDQNLQNRQSKIFPEKMH